MVLRKKKLLDGPELLDYALRSLSARALSSSEIRMKLHRRAATPTDVDEVLTKLADAGYLNDERFAEAYAAARRDNQGFGQMRVLRDLRTRRVSGDIADAAVKTAFEETNETTMVEHYLARKYRAVDLPQFLTAEKNLASAYRRLRTAGFSSRSSIEVLKRYAARAGELEDSDPPEEESSAVEPTE